MAMISWRNWLGCGLCGLLVVGLTMAAQGRLLAQSSASRAVDQGQAEDDALLAGEAPPADVAERDEMVDADFDALADERFDEEAPVAAPAADVSPLRIALIGSTLIEREQRYGYWETWLLASRPEQPYVVRNLGWSGDTVFGESRAGFGKPRDGYDKLLEQVRSVRPDVVVVAYGTNASFEGEEGLSSFRSGLDQLIRDLRTTQAKIVLMTPPPFEDAGVPGVDTPARNRDLGLYAAAIRGVAEDWELQHIDLFAGVPSLPQSASVLRTDNGMHFSAYGYWLSAPLAMSPFTEPQSWRLSLVLNGERLIVEKSSGTTVIDAQANVGGRETLVWSVRDAALPAPLPPGKLDHEGGPTPAARLLRIQGLPVGRYELRIDRQTIATAPAEAWSRGVAIQAGPDFQQVEELRAAILKKNELFFHRWRPQNETYLFGFRKHEQGQNAREIPQFDPLVAEMEEVIAAVRQPKRRYYELRKLGQ